MHQIIIPGRRAAFLRHKSTKMKKLNLLFFACLFAVISHAQAPQSINYQAVARNSAGAALANQTIKVRLSVFKNAVLQYSETRQVVTNLLGLFNVQIGSSGALSTTGTFSSIDWLNNAAPGYVLKVELDINNSGLFTDMGNTPFSSVPFSLVADKAATASNADKIGGRAVDAGNTPSPGDHLVWSGASWTSIKKDTIIPISGSIPTIVAGGSNSPWAFAGSTLTRTITVTGNETIVATFTGSFGHNSNGVYVPVAAAICYQNISGGTITSFYPEFPTTAIPAGLSGSTHDYTFLSATGAIKLPAGTYRIGMGIKNYHNSINLSNNESLNGFIEVRY